MAITRVQGNAADSGNNAFGSISVTISAVGSGNSVCGIVSWDNSASTTLTSVTDDKGNTYNVETTVTDTTNNQRSAAFSRTNITNAPVTVTANFSNSPVFRKILVDEFSGTSTASTDERDGSAHGGQFQNSPGTGTDAITSGPFTTSNSGDLLFGGCIGATTTALATHGTNFTDGTQNNASYSGQTEYQIQSVSGSGTAATLTQAVDTQRMTFLIAIKAPGEAPNPTERHSFPPPRDPTDFFPVSGRTAIAAPMQQQVVPRPQLMGQMVM